MTDRIDWRTSKIDGRLHAYDKDRADKGPLCLSASKVAGDDSRRSPCPTCRVLTEVFGNRPPLSGQATRPVSGGPIVHTPAPAPVSNEETVLAGRLNRDKGYFIVRLDSGSTMEFWGESTREHEMMGGNAYAVFVGPGETGALLKIRKKDIQSMIVLHEDDKAKNRGLLGAAKRLLRKVGLGRSS